MKRVERAREGSKPNLSPRFPSYHIFGSLFLFFTHRCLSRNFEEGHPHRVTLKSSHPPTKNNRLLKYTYRAVHTLCPTNPFVHSRSHAQTRYDDIPLLSCARRSSVIESKASLVLHTPSRPHLLCAHLSTWEQAKSSLLNLISLSTSCRPPYLPSFLARSWK